MFTSFPTWVINILEISCQYGGQKWKHLVLLQRVTIKHLLSDNPFFFLFHEVPSEIKETTHKSTWNFYLMLYSLNPEV